MGRNKLDCFLMAYYSQAYDWLRESTEASNFAAYDVLHNPVLKQANEMRDHIINIFEGDTYDIRKGLWREDREYFDAKFNSTLDPEYSTRAQFNRRFAYFKAHSTKKLAELEIRTNPDVLAQWAQAKANLKK